LIDINIRPPPKQSEGRTKKRTEEREVKGREAFRCTGNKIKTEDARWTLGGNEGRERPLKQKAAVKRKRQNKTAVAGGRLYGP